VDDSVEHAQSQPLEHKVNFVLDWKRPFQIFSVTGSYVGAQLWDDFFE
jgi:hypothetical protein